VIQYSGVKKLMAETVAEGIFFTFQANANLFYGDS